MRLLVFILNATVQLAVAAAGFLMLLLALNGFSEAQATPSLIFYIVAAIASAVVLGFASGTVATRLVEKRSFSKGGASTLSVLSFALIGFVLLIAIVIVAVILAEVVRGIR